MVVAGHTAAGVRCIGKGDGVDVFVERGNVGVIGHCTRIGQCLAAHTGAHGHIAGQAGAAVVDLGSRQRDGLGCNVGRGGGLGAAQGVVAGQPAAGVCGIGQCIAGGRDGDAVGLVGVGKRGRAVVENQRLAAHRRGYAAPVADADAGCAVIDLVVCGEARDSERLGRDGGGGGQGAGAQRVVTGY